MFFSTEKYRNQKSKSVMKSIRSAISIPVHARYRKPFSLLWQKVVRKNYLLEQKSFKNLIVERSRPIKLHSELKLFKNLTIPKQRPEKLYVKMFKIN